MKQQIVCAISLLTLTGAALAAEIPPDFAAQFREGDTNHDGKLSYDEYKAARVMRDGGKVDEEKVKHYVERFAALDVNKDKLLTLDEYKARITNEKYQPAQPAAK